MGFIKLDRQIIDSSIWDDGEPFDSAHAWIDLLLYVNWKDNDRIIRKKIVKVKRGSQFLSDQFLANRWHWSRNRVRRYIQMLENAGMITVNRTADGTYINVVNYAKFQDRQTADGTTNDTTDGTTGDTTDGTQSKNNKKNKEEQEFLSGAAAQKKVPPKPIWVEDYCREQGYRINVSEFMAYYNLNGWTLSGGRKITDWHAAVDYWQSKGRKIDKADGDGFESMPAYQEFAHTPVELGEEPKFEGGVVAELLRRKRMKNA